MTTTARRFTIADVMILIVAAALATVLARDYFTSLYVVYKGKSVDRPIALAEGLSTCVASAILLALIPIRLRRPRPGLRRLARQPGFVASCAVAAALAAGVAQGLILISFRTWGYKRGPWPFQQLWAIGAEKCFFAIAGAWLLLALSGRWRAEPGWIDRLGRLMGAVWIFGILVMFLETWIFRHLPAL